MSALALIGTDTGVGKTHVAALLARGLRGLGRRVWLHKPVACGGWDGTASEDGRALRGLCGDGQDPATICPREFPEACSPHLAAQAAGTALELAALVDAAEGCHRLAAVGGGGGEHGILLMETAGGLLAPLTPARQTNADLLAALAWPAILVTRPHLGTLNHTQLTVNETCRRGIRLLGLVLNHHEELGDGLAVRSAAAELGAMTGLPVLAALPFAPPAAMAGTGQALARAVASVLP